MNGRAQQDQNLHDELLKSLAKNYSSLGYIGIRSDVPGSGETPGGIFWKDNPDKKYIPDIVCYKNDTAGTLIVAEIETCDSLDTEHTNEQWKIFSTHAKAKNGEFHVMTPKSCIEQAKSIAKTLGITVHKYWWRD